MKSLLVTLVLSAIHGRKLSQKDNQCHCAAKHPGYRSQASRGTRIFFLFVTDKMEFPWNLQVILLQ